MGAIQSAINRTIGTLTAVSKLASFDKEKMAKANLQAQNQKVLKLKQKALSEKYRAEFAKSKFEKIKYKQKYSDLKQSNNVISIGGQQITDPQLLKKIKEQI